jgi:hypothetical protein
MMKFATVDDLPVICKLFPSISNDILTTYVKHEEIVYDNHVAIKSMTVRIR